LNPRVAIVLAEDKWLLLGLLYKSCALPK